MSAEVWHWVRGVVWSAAMANMVYQTGMLVRSFLRKRRLLRDLERVHRIQELVVKGLSGGGLTALEQAELDAHQVWLAKEVGQCCCQEEKKD